MPKAGYAQLSFYQKLHLKEMLDEGYTKVEIAKRLQVHKSTIYNELKRGNVNGIYDPEFSEKKKREISTEKIQPLLVRDKTLARYISYLILQKHMSPEAITVHLSEEKEKHGFEKYPSSPATIYSAIDDGLIPDVTRYELNANMNKDITKVYSDCIHLPVWIRKKMGIKNGDKYRFECKCNGDIVLKKI